MAVLTHDSKQYVLIKSRTWVNGYDVLVSDGNSFVPTGFQVIGAPDDDYVTVTTDKTDMPVNLAMMFCRLAYPNYRPQPWDQLTDINSLVLEWRLALYKETDTSFAAHAEGYC